MTYKAAVLAGDNAKVLASQVTHRAYATGYLAPYDKGRETQAQYGERFGVSAGTVAEWWVLGKALDNGVKPLVEKGSTWRLLSSYSGYSLKDVRKAIMAGKGDAEIRKALAVHFDLNPRSKTFGAKRPRTSTAASKAKAAKAAAKVTPSKAKAAATKVLVNFTSAQRCAIAVDLLRANLGEVGDDEAREFLVSLAAIVNARTRTLPKIVTSNGGTATSEAPKVTSKRTTSKRSARVRISA